jgi:small subunit ribosomal protein S1
MANILDKLAEEVDKISGSQKTVPGEEDNASKKKEARVKTVESPMADLLEESPVDLPKVGDVLEGTVIDISSSSILLDLGPWGTGVVLGKEAKDGLERTKLKKGSKVNATLIDLENDEGSIELSIREASREKAWQDLESKRDERKVITTKISDANKGGLMIEINGIAGFIPVSQLSNEHYPRVEDGDKNKILERLKELVGKELKIRIVDVDRQSEKLIASEKAAFSEEEKAAVSQLKAGDVITGEVSGVVDFGAFVKFFPPGMESKEEKDKLEGLVHISELAWQLIDDPREIVKTGDQVKAEIIGIDDMRISLSMKALQKDPWESVGKKYKVGDKVKGKVDKINPFGAFVYLDKDIHGLAHISEFRGLFPGKRMDEVIKESGAYNWEILSIEPKEHRMGLMFVKEGKKSTSGKSEKAEKPVEEAKKEKTDQDKPAAGEKKNGK